MNILNLLDLLEDELEKGGTLPMIGKSLINREKCLDIIRDIRLNIPEEMKQAEWVKKERQRILVEAQKEAETVIKEAEYRINTLVDENEITKKAYQASREIIESAQNNAKDIRLGAKEYADVLLQEIDTYLIEQLQILRKNRQELNTLKK